MDNGGKQYELHITLTNINVKLPKRSEVENNPQHSWVSKNFKQISKVTKCPRWSCRTTFLIIKLTEEWYHLK